MKNYHTHKKRCYDAIDNEEEYVKAAIQSGYTELGFSDHTPWHYETSYHSTMRMEEDKLVGYVQTLLNLREKYQDQISIKIGLECEDYPSDYIILGNHFDETDETGIYFGRPLNKQQLTKYVESCIAGIKTGLYSYVAHPDLAFYDTDDPFYTQEMTRLCQAAKEYQMPLEFNLLGYATHRQYPNETFFNIAKKVGNKVIIGTDAHESSALLDMNTYQLGKQWLERLGLELTEDIKFLI